MDKDVLDSEENSFAVWGKAVWWKSIDLSWRIIVGEEQETWLDSSGSEIITTKEWIKQCASLSFMLSSRDNEFLHIK